MWMAADGSSLIIDEDTVEVWPHTIRYQTQTVRPDTVQHLYHHVSQVEDKKIKDSSRLWVRHDGLQMRTGDLCHRDMRKAIGNL